MEAIRKNQPPDLQAPVKVMIRNARFTCRGSKAAFLEAFMAGMPVMGDVSNAEALAPVAELHAFYEAEQTTLRAEAVERDRVIAAEEAMRAIAPPAPAVQDVYFWKLENPEFAGEVRRSK